MRYDSDTERVIISVDELAKYAYRRENSALLDTKFGFIKTVVTSDESAHCNYSSTEEERLSDAISNIADGYAEYIDATHTELPLSKDVMCGEYDVCVEGLSDIISYDGVLHTVETIKPVRKITRELSPFSDPECFARASVLSCMYAESIGVSEIKIKLTFISKSSGERASFTALFSKAWLDRMFTTLLSRAEPFVKNYAENVTVFPAEADRMPFPYPSIREGQETFVKAAYRAIKKGEDLLVSAPTGIGKTMSALFPSVKALGAGYADRIFYLTAKTVTGRAALDGVKLLSEHCPHLSAVMILSKEMTCPYKHRFSAPGVQSKCYFCDKMNGMTRDGGYTTVSYTEREISALAYLISLDDKIYSPDIIRTTAEEYSVCPYELSLDLSEYCHVIVCDCNYVTDDNVRFRRYFKKDGNTDRYVFLFDEAHNLPDRVRNTYSSVVTLSSARKLFEVIENNFTDNCSLYDAAVMYVRSLEEIHSLARENEYVKQKNGEDVSCGYLEDRHVTDGFAKAARELGKSMFSAMRDRETAEILSEYYSDIYKLGFVLSFFDDRFRFFACREGDDVTVELLCIDPSGILDTMLSAASSVIMFSATLTPIDYFRDVMGMKSANVLELESPYEHDNLCLISYDSVSTRFTDRKTTSDDCAEIIVSTVSARQGNYIVYFPSYDYMKTVCRSFSHIMSDCSIVMQKPGMSYRERQRFIDIFREKRGETVVGFCVLGGMFSEGIDLAGESLIGVIIVGCGMPQLSAERNIMAAYYDEKTERGKDYAYTCPGMNKVMQAAGRVIRSETDRGVIVLIDDRHGDPNLRILFPTHWRNMLYTSNLTSLGVILDDFWDKNEDAYKK